MNLHPSRVPCAAACLALAAAGCATATSPGVLVAGSPATVDGTIAAIDTQPWTYDGNAVVLLDTAAHGRVSVQLPARWNLCKAAPVELSALAVGRHARAVGIVGGERALVVCERAEDRLVPVD